LRAWGIARMGAPKRTWKPTRNESPRSSDQLRRPKVRKWISAEAAVVQTSLR